MNSNLSSSEPILPNYLQKGKLIGEGGFAKVYEFQNTEKNSVFAGKVIEKNSVSKSRARQKLLSEIKIHKSLSHPNIVKLYSYHEDKENIYIIL